MIAEPEHEDLRLEQRKQDLDAARLDLDRQRFRAEARRAIWTAIATVVPIFTALAAIFMAQWAQLVQSRAAFQLKTAELVVGVTDPGLAHSRAIVLGELFPDFVPKGLERTFEGRFLGPLIEDRALVARLISEHPENRRFIVSVWLTLFPNDAAIAAMGEIPYDEPCRVESRSKGAEN